ncbi:unnamed protein product, partial [Choristocarpus tenellus]
MELSPPLIGLSSSESAYLGGTVYGDRVFLEPMKSFGEVLTELREQVSLIDCKALLMGTGCSNSTNPKQGCATAEAVVRKFRRRDPFSTGVISPRDLSLALEDIGISLQPGEVTVLVEKYQRPDQNLIGTSSNMKGGHETNTQGREGKGRHCVRVEYAPLVRHIVDVIEESIGMDTSQTAASRLRKRGKWYDKLPQLARRLQSKLSERQTRGWVGRLKQRFYDFDLNGEGKLGPREFLRALKLALAELDSGSIVITEEEGVALLDHLVNNKEKNVSWEEFFDFFAEWDKEGTSKAREDVWYGVDNELAQKLLHQMEIHGGNDARRTWFNSTKHRLQSIDAGNTGVIDRSDFASSLHNMGIELEPQEMLQLQAALRVEEGQGIRYGELLDFYCSHLSDWHEAEVGIAEKILAAMGADPIKRRAWLSRVRQRFMRLDPSHCGAMGALDFLQTLSHEGCDLSHREEARLLDALAIEESPRYSWEGEVNYRELLLFCARHAGSWNDAQPGLAMRLQTMMRKQAYLRHFFREMDTDGDGTLERDNFR